VETPTTAEAIDCVEFKHRAQMEIYVQFRGMTHDQDRAYFEQQAALGPISEWWKRMKAAHRP
jgi:hypothetical protein